MTAIRNELCEVAEIEQKEKESWPKFAERLVRTIDKKEISEEDWSQVSPEAQEWFNSAVDSIAGKVAIRNFPDEAPAAKEKKDKPAKAASNGAKGGGRPRVPNDAVLKNVKPNPYKEGSKNAQVYDLYKDGMTLDEVIKAGAPRAWVLWERRHGNLELQHD